MHSLTLIFLSCRSRISILVQDQVQEERRAREALEKRVDSLTYANASADRVGDGVVALTRPPPPPPPPRGARGGDRDVVAPSANAYARSGHVNPSSNSTRGDRDIVSSGSSVNAYARSGHTNPASNSTRSPPRSTRSGERDVSTSANNAFGRPGQAPRPPPPISLVPSKKSLARFSPVSSPRTKKRRGGGGGTPVSSTKPPKPKQPPVSSTKPPKPKQPPISRQSSVEKRPHVGAQRSRGSVPDQPASGGGAGGDAMTSSFFASLNSDKKARDKHGVGPFKRPMNVPLSHDILNQGVASSNLGGPHSTPPSIRGVPHKRRLSGGGVSAGGTGGVGVVGGGLSPHSQRSPRRLRQGGGGGRPSLHAVRRRMSGHSSGPESTTSSRRREVS